MYLLGLSCFERDSAACLVCDGRVVAAVEEERLTRQKHESRFPENALRAVLKQEGITGARLDAVAICYLPQSQQETDLMVGLQDACGFRGAVTFHDHILSHAAATYFTAPCDEAAVLILDDAQSALFHGRGVEITQLPDALPRWPLGCFCAAVTQYLGFKPYEGEYKVMGLAPYGEPAHLDALRALMTQSGGASELAMRWGHPRHPEDDLQQIHKDLAASLQKLIEETVLALAQVAKEKTGAKHLCLGGALAHNVVANAQLAESNLFDSVFIHFASGNAGCAIGAALQAYATKTECKPRLTPSLTPYLGPEYTEDEIFAAIENSGFTYEKLDRAGLLDRAARALNDGQVVAWFQGRMEFGPRALGNRSLLASASCATMKDFLNESIKHREPFRPFAPAVLAEDADDYFTLKGDGATMLYAAQVKLDKRAALPAATHSDGSARPQIVRREDNALFYDLITEYKVLSKVPAVINTSFNVRGEPIVCSPQDALACYANTEIPYLAIGSFLVKKA